MKISIGGGRDMRTLGFQGAGRKNASSAWKHAGAAIYALIGLIIAGLGAAVLSNLPWKAGLVHIETRDWPTVPAQIISVSLRADTGGIEAGLALDVVYRFEVDGAVIDGSRASYADVAPRHDRRLRGLYQRLDFARITGRTVAVAYDPKNPASAYLDRGFDWRAVAPRAGIGLAGLLFGLFLMVRPLRRPEPSLL